MQKYLPVWFQLKEIKSESKNTTISSLAPKILTKKEDLKKVQPYLDKLKDTLNVKGINNIALTGGYGSGKSTLLKTFQHWNNNDFNFLNISLAAFNQTKTKENFKDLYELKIKNGKTEQEAEKEIVNQFKETLISNDELEKQLEISILQQIIYKVKPSKLPESRFKRIINIPKWKLFFSIPFGFILWISSIILLFKYDYLNNINPNTWHFKHEVAWTTIIIFIIAFLGIGYFSKLVVEIFSNSKINKVNLKGEIEIGDDSNKSILNEHYDEILYYFEQNDFNVVVIEDLDRFDNTNIFTKLRELNILLNNADTLSRKSAYKDFGIKFLYAVGDDLFNDKKERVKFFEYIIPVIPFINSTNANDQLKTLIKESELEENVFPKEFLSDVTTFIDDIDMRLLINIFHEFVIYRNILKPDVLSGSEAQLFAMITYKNIDPEDFNKLNSKEGKLYKLINEKNLYIKEFIASLDGKITLKNIEIQNIKRETIIDVKELRKIYINQILTKFPNNGIYINEIKISDFIEENKFNSLIEDESISYRSQIQGYYEPSRASLNFKFSEIEHEVNPNFSYIKRVELVESKHNNQIELLQKEIEKLKIKKSEVQNWDLKQIFNEFDINQYLNNFSNNGLLRNLILEGYINENYNDYISLFHEVSLTKEDKKFERNVKSGIIEGFDYKLTHVENLIDNHIELKYFGRETILNFDILNHLGEDYSKYSEKFNAIIELLSNEKEKSIEFIDRYISDEDRPLAIFIEKLVKNWKGFWDYIYLKSNYTPDKVDKYLAFIIQYAKIGDILSSQNKNTLATAIMQKPHFLSLVKNTVDLNYSSKIIKLIELLNVNFEKLENPNEETKELFEFVLNNGYYQINKDNLLQMLILYGEKVETFETSNYSTIQNSNCTPLIEYINANINIYVEDVYLKLEQNKFDNEDTLFKLLNNGGLDDNLKIKIIQKVETIITDLKNIDDIKFKKELLINNKVSPNWSNVINYFTDCENKIDENLIDYLNLANVSSILSKLKFSREDIKFEMKMLVCNEINDEVYSKLLNSCFFIYPTLNFEHLTENKTIKLINKLTTTKSNYDILRKNFANNHILLIEKDFTKFIDNIDDFETDDDDILLILKSNRIGINNGFKYISTISELTIIDNKEIAKEVGDIIVNKSEIVEFESNTLNSLITHSDTNENKVKLINLYFTTLSNDDITTLVKIIGWDYKELFVKQHQPKFKDNTYNRELLGKLKSKKLINSFDTYKKDKTKIKAVANY